jgi:hypothetical protein
MVETVSVLIGFVAGVVAAGIAVEFGLKKLLSPPDNSKLTRVWSLSELQEPLIVTTSIEGVSVPKGAQVVTRETLPPGSSHYRARTNGEVRGNFAVDAKNPRAVLFLGGIKKDSLALWTVDDSLITRLRAEFNRLWTRSLDYVEQVSIADAPKRANAAIEMTGHVQDVLPFKDRFMMRLTDKGETIGVILDKPMDVTGQRVTVKGIVKPSTSGFALVEAVEVTRRN